ncbi:hypothetical protein APUTEX25_005847 [Auxenochlorella protothecoides]|uniref:Uncharacterized protein n=1 Tax=Auxenochlorella protothecoides TaxID=3075 RepID=A0A3M7L2W3_AUXPR|nr:hypothetical protein APUTEX25_005847 [Auxenochlorella protothecoides]|eukprot:RMZ55806.1 hypothetical protein APUTEX25_005847 [Auxenochlorella protothecoides]
MSSATRWCWRGQVGPSGQLPASHRAQTARLVGSCRRLHPLPRRGQDPVLQYSGQYTGVRCCTARLAERVVGRRRGVMRSARKARRRAARGSLVGWVLGRGVAGPDSAGAPATGRAGLGAPEVRRHLRLWQR